ncbi:RloB domain-containing protein [Chryseobacterium shandongense]|uniref:RloB domain-containing protein n=1 Tax=Chryseobacterium shandongense TaxID=1493872 RepID=A0AAD1DNV9_9FLAO|nr:RloB family protein [Chryseobacterium shandongense]AZA88700.1 RloB domain-containing protein [Chryseobacterium shandongense]AZA97241.1 RloB domain-containing protein [Chryseobacterium shandongense]
MAKQDKKVTESRKAEEHKQRMLDAKARRRAGTTLERPEPSLEIKPSILIYCEGENTEPSYFNKFKVSSATIEAFGEGKNTLSLVKEAIKIAKKAKEDGRPFDQIWCVFDADPKPDNPKQLQNFNDAVALCNTTGLYKAYSHQAFEYWLILHFEDHQGGAMPRTDYDKKLNDYLKPYGISYDGYGSKIVTSEIFKVLFEQMGTGKNGEIITRCDIATKRADNIYKNHAPHHNPGKEESSTLVYELVKELLKYA